MFPISFASKEIGDVCTQSKLMQFPETYACYVENPFRRSNCTCKARALAFLNFLFFKISRPAAFTSNL